MKCAFYGYLPTRNGTRVLTPRSGNVESVNGGKRQDEPDSSQLPTTLLLSFLRSLVPQKMRFPIFGWKMLSANKAGDTAMPPNCDGLEARRPSS